MDTSKWFGSSLTVWGVIVSVLSGAAPFIGGLTGHDVSTDIQTVGKSGVDVINAAQALFVAGGVFVGGVMSIIGRFSAKTSLTVGKTKAPSQ